MKKNSTCDQSSKQRGKSCQGPSTMGMDLGDKSSRYCLLDSNGEVVEEGSVSTTKKEIGRAHV